MYFLFSGEGATDLGTGLCENLSEGDDYKHGPLALLVDQIIQEKYNYSIIDSQGCGYVSKARITKHSKTSRSNRKFHAPRGDITDFQGTGEFYHNARALAAIAKKIASEKKDEVVAILFRDSDGTNSSKSTQWQKKFDSMCDGFKSERFSRGVPMIPKPVSEAWILCAIYRMENENRNCDELENRTYGSGSQHALKTELESKLNAQAEPSLLNEKVKTGGIHFRFIDVNSFTEFKDHLKKVIR